MENIHIIGEKNSVQVVVLVGLQNFANLVGGIDTDPLMEIRVFVVKNGNSILSIDETEK